MKKLITSLFVVLLLTTQVFPQATALTPNTIVTSQTLTPTLSWTADGTPPPVTHYRVTVAAASPVAGGVGVYVSAAIAVPTVSQIVPGATLAENTQYYWIVESSTAGPGGPWIRPSLEATFKTIPVAPALTTPAAAATGVAVTTTFVWGGVAGGNFYQLQVNDDGTFTNANEFAPAPGNYTTSPAATGLSTGTVYSWRVRASNDGGATYGAWSAVRTFTTVLPNPVLTAPADLASGISITPDFTWTWSGGPATYTITIATDPGFAAPNIVYPATAATSPYSLPIASALNNGTIYYWRIIATVGAVTSSATGRFSTIFAAIPSLVSPAHLSTIVGNTIHFQWTMPTGSLQYILEVDNGAGFGSPELTTAATTLNSFSYPYTLTTLPAGTYFWRVKSYTMTNLLISISSTYQFVISGPPTAVPAYPINLTTVYSNSPIIYWYLNNYYYNQGVYYRVRYATVLGGPYGGGGAISPTTTNQWVPLNNLTIGQTYYYVIDASTSSGFGAGTTTSTEGSFVVFYSAVNGIPVYLSYPLGNTVYSLTPTLYWYLGVHVPGVTFDVQVNNGTDFTPNPALEVDQSGVSAYQLTTSTLTAGTSYVWRVRITGSTAWYGPETFTVDPSATTAPSAADANIPTPTSPIGGTVVATQSPVLNWTTSSLNVLEYQIIYSSNPTLTGGVLSTNVTPPNTALGGTSGWLVTNSYALSSLTQGATYYWQVRARLASPPNTVSNYSSVAQFTVAPGASPVVVLPANPLVGQAINSTAANLSWIVPAQSTSALTYDLQISKNKDMSGATLINNLPQPNYKAENLSANTKYYWQVRSRNAGGSFSSYSYKGEFSTGTATAVEEDIIPTTFELSQNYPNPFNPTTKISYALPQNAYVSIKVYDMLGREVRSLVSNEMLAGSHSIEWSGEDNTGNKVASGAYIYRITAGNFVSTKKMVLIK
ncbi:hypothetical protein C0389_00760 [bacterium]|nr:hypothetical protein [bacterium]